MCNYYTGDGHCWKRYTEQDTIHTPYSGADFPRFSGHSAFLLKDTLHAPFSEPLEMVIIVCPVSIRNKRGSQMTTEPGIEMFCHRFLWSCGNPAPSHGQVLQRPGTDKLPANLSRPCPQSGKRAGFPQAPQERRLRRSYIHISMYKDTIAEKAFVFNVRVGTIHCKTQNVHHIRGLIIRGFRAFRRFCLKTQTIHHFRILRGW